MRAQASRDLKCGGPGSRVGRTCGTRVSLVSSPLVWAGILESWPLAEKLQGNGAILEFKPCPRCKRINLFREPSPNGGT